MSIPAVTPEDVKNFPSSTHRASANPCHRGALRRHPLERRTCSKSPACRPVRPTWPGARFPCTRWQRTWPLRPGAESDFEKGLVLDTSRRVPIPPGISSTSRPWSPARLGVCGAGGSLVAFNRPHGLGQHEEPGAGLQPPQHLKRPEHIQELEPLEKDGAHREGARAQGDRGFSRGEARAPRRRPASPKSRPLLVVARDAHGRHDVVPELDDADPDHLELVVLRGLPDHGRRR
jgi:hypothetical protein